jgi:hypothetical protein
MLALTGMVWKLCATPWEGYTILEFSEGIESTLPFAQRVAHGVVRIAAAPR